MQPTKNKLHAPSGVEAHIMTVLEVARFLRVPVSTVYRLARIRQLPSSKVGKHWRFVRQEIENWMHGRSYCTDRRSDDTLLTTSILQNDDGPHGTPHQKVPMRTGYGVSNHGEKPKT